jgi:hypothetical protein
MGKCNSPVHIRFGRMIWKKLEKVGKTTYGEPPNKEAFTVITAEPHHTSTNTVANISADCWSEALKESDKESSRQRSKGPHKSPGIK